MPYDTDLARRLESIIQEFPEYFQEKRMFGGLGYLLNGHMVCGVHREFLMLRVGVERAGRLLALPGVRPMDFTGRVMKGWLTADPEVTGDEAGIRPLVAEAVEFVRTLPPK